jgi:hypothetical protein
VSKPWLSTLGFPSLATFTPGTLHRGPVTQPQVTQLFFDGPPSCLVHSKARQGAPAQPLAPSLGHLST